MRAGWTGWVGWIVSRALAGSSLGSSAWALTERPLAWERVGHGLEPEPSAVAASRDGVIVLGGTEGLRRVEGGRARTLRTGPVHDVVATADGAWFVATTEAVWRLGDDGRLRAETGTAGGPARSATRLAAGAGRVAAATPEGVRLRDAAGHWRRVGELPTREISFVALRARGAEAELWAGSEGALWIAGLEAGPDSAVAFARQVRIAAGQGRLWRDAAFTCPGADVLLLAADGLWQRDAHGRWRDLRPVWPPGATARRLLCAGDRIFVASDAGLLVASQPQGPWRRAGAPLGTVPALALARDARSIWVANQRGLWRGRAGAPAPIELVTRSPAGEPSIAALQRAARRHLGLDARSIQALRRRASRRGWWPELDLRVGYDHDRERQHDADQSFVSGETRFLQDITHDRGDRWSAELSLSWDLGDAAFDPEEIDAAREARAWIALRDVVLDEVNQLYSERRRALARRAALPPDDPERAELALRVDELAAGLDAWTGGGFSRRPDPVPPTPHEEE